MQKLINASIVIRVIEKVTEVTENNWFEMKTYAVKSTVSHHVG